MAQRVSSGGTFLFGKDLDLALLEEDEGSRGDAMHEEDIGTDGGVFADESFAAEDGRIWVNSDAAANIGVTFSAFNDFPRIVALEAAGTEGDAVVEFDMVANAAGFADDDAGAVVDEEVGAETGSRMNINAGAAVGPFGHDTGEKGNSRTIEAVGGTLDGDGLDRGIGENDFLQAGRGGVAFVGGFEIALEQFAEGGQVGEEFRCKVEGTRLGAFAFG